MLRGEALWVFIRGIGYKNGNGNGNGAQRRYRDQGVRGFDDSGSITNHFSIYYQIPTNLNMPNISSFVKAHCLNKTIMYMLWAMYRTLTFIQDINKKNASAIPTSKVNCTIQQ